MELEEIFPSSVDNGIHEWRMRLSPSADAFLREMKAKGFPAAKLVSFIIEQAIPAYKPKGYTYDGYDRMKKEIRSLY